MAVRDHQGITIDQFNGLWQRGDIDNTPLDHFSDCNNIKFIGDSSFGTRDGIGISQTVATSISRVKRIYNYPTQTGNTLIVLTTGNPRATPNFTVSPLSPYPYELEDEFNEDMSSDGNISFMGQIDMTGPVGNINEQIEPDFIPNVISIENSDVTINDVGSIYHVISPTLVYGPILSIIGMTDFAFIPYAGRAYISPFTSYTITALDGTTLNQEKGLFEEFVYIYAGNGTQARKAAGDSLSGSMTVANGAAGHTDPGQHIFGIVSQTSSGYNAPPSILTSFVTTAASSVSFGNIPTSSDSNVVKRLLVATRVLPTFNGDLSGYQFFFVPNAVINNNLDTFLNNISFYDADLLADASALLDNYTSIPAGAILSLYHNRLLVAATNTDISLILVSQVGEPEAINQIDGLIVVPLDGNPITNAQEMRDILYVFKRSRTVSYVDNGDVPSSWPLVVIDNALGTCVHGIATVLDSGSSNIDFLIVCTYQGISVFNGRYITPEISWKIEAFWQSLDRNNFRYIQIINAPTQKILYIVLPDGRLLSGNYINGFDQKKIRWTPNSFQVNINTIAIANISDIILGAS